jgi:hypothetical protein
VKFYNNSFHVIKYLEGDYCINEVDKYMGIVLKKHLKKNSQLRNSQNFICFDLDKMNINMQALDPYGDDAIQEFI